MSNAPTRLIKHQQELQALDTERYKHRVSYREEHWRKQFSTDQDFVYLVKQHPEGITRGDIAELACAAWKSHDASGIRQLFLATMIWGYGTVGYGPHRTRGMLESSDALETLTSTFAYVISGNLQEAYQRFNLSKCGSAFFTKYFYLIGLGGKVNPQPLILDSFVADALERWMGLDIKQFASVTKRKAGRITAVGRNVRGYQNYLDLMNDWACQLQCCADSIELFLFRTRQQDEAA